MTNLPADKKQFFKVFLAFYFLFFSISPLTYAFSDGQAPENAYAAGKNAPCLKSALSFRASFAERQAAEGTPHANGKTDVLVKKKRAVAPEDPSEKISYLATASVPRNNFCKPSAPTARCISKNVLEINKGFNPLLAGNSPPAF